MAAQAGGETVKAPGNLVISQEVVLLHITVGTGKGRLGGLALAQFFYQLPLWGLLILAWTLKYLKRAFNAMQDLIGKKLISAGHNIEEILLEVGDETTEPLESETDQASTESAVKDLFTTLSFRDVCKSQEVEKIPEEVAKFPLEYHRSQQRQDPSWQRKIWLENYGYGNKVLSNFGQDRDSGIIHLAFEPVEKVARNYFQHITETENTIFTDSEWHSCVHKKTSLMTISASTLSLFCIFARW
ncbi:hypothetical protein SELMODRAFT_428634 [Selaginella moellendorffii]|uniref:Uncharacterized protein n=1 Tax=Selaginella moellendorffii TaxID=88036 RepID=D8T3H3_SELML|nr:hypothetical protein SELMODRAFT_428634 [Selaginella moellendorffii]